MELIPNKWYCHQEVEVTKISTKYRHLHRIAIWHAAHNDIGGQRCLSLLVILLLCLEEEFPGKQSTAASLTLVQSGASL
ncbi:hypothetical protein TNCV_4325561 [Trichonephila clavipes]|nr:hypothetical protein TNCV_4325561 [Trichonephila clavipes]